MLIGSAAEDKRLLRIVQQVAEREVSGDVVDPMEAAALVVTIRCVPVRKFDRPSVGGLCRGRGSDTTPSVLFRC